MTREEIFNYIANEYGTPPEYLCNKYPSYAVLPHQTNRKWYGIMMTVERKNLGLDQSGSEDVMDIKMAPDQIDILQTMKGFLPAYHMNKGHWLSVRIGEVSATQIRQLIDASYQLTMK